MVAPGHFSCPAPLGGGGGEGARGECPPLQPRYLFLAAPGNRIGGGLGQSVGRGGKQGFWIEQASIYLLAAGKWATGGTGGADSSSPSG